MVVPLTGYSNKLSVEPGDGSGEDGDENTIEFKISSIFDEPYQADLIRIVHGDPNPNGPGLKYIPVGGTGNVATAESTKTAMPFCCFGREYPSRFQSIELGSYVITDQLNYQRRKTRGGGTRGAIAPRVGNDVADTASSCNFYHDGSFTAGATVWPTLLRNRTEDRSGGATQHCQVILSSFDLSFGAFGFCLGINPISGCFLTIVVPDDDDDDDDKDNDQVKDELSCRQRFITVRVGKPMTERKWYRVLGIVNVSSGKCSVYQYPIDAANGCHNHDAGGKSVFSEALRGLDGLIDDEEIFLPGRGGPILIAARRDCHYSHSEDEGFCDGTMAIASQQPASTSFPSFPPKVYGHFNGKIESPFILDHSVSGGEDLEKVLVDDAEDENYNSYDFREVAAGLWQACQDEIIDETSVLAHWDFTPAIDEEKSIHAHGESILANFNTSFDSGHPVRHQSHHLHRSCAQSVTVRDVGPLGLHGTVVNCPSRGVTGHNWSGREMCWRHAPKEYGAIHFHEDDLSDCRWETDFAFVVPPDMKSGVYGARIRCCGEEDIIPFYVRPRMQIPMSTDVVFLAPTFTYQIYANHIRGNADEAYFKRVNDWVGARKYHPDQHGRDYGASTYNLHSDGSGICFASRLRPMLTFRPGFLTFANEDAGSGLRHFAADTHLLDWLEEMGQEYDVVTDDDLDEYGVKVIEPYRVLLTGSHPEYQTRATLHALQSYVDHGGRFMYLGGNGFYWRVARVLGSSKNILTLQSSTKSSDAKTHKTRHPLDGLSRSPVPLLPHSLPPGLLEIRRAEGGVRAWASEPGEYYHSLDGWYGGLFRRNGHPPQQLVGVGFSGQGLFVGSHYVRTEESKLNPRVSWIFKGVDDEENVLGNFGLSGGGAAGYELDRVDRQLGTPCHAVILASSRGHHGEKNGGYIPVYEDMLTHVTTCTGDKPEDLIRADMVFFETGEDETANGSARGAVFSVGSIAFCGSLSHNNYQNSISRIVLNVLTRFRSSQHF